MDAYWQSYHEIAEVARALCGRGGIEHADDGDLETKFEKLHADDSEKWDQVIRDTGTTINQ